MRGKENEMGGKKLAVDVLIPLLEGTPTVRVLGVFHPCQGERLRISPSIQHTLNSALILFIPMILWEQCRKQFVGPGRKRD